MIIDEIGTKILPANWEMWATGSKFQAMKKDATESDKTSYTPLYKKRVDAINEARRLTRYPHNRP